MKCLSLGRYTTSSNGNILDIVCTFLNLYPVRCCFQGKICQRCGILSFGRTEADFIRMILQLMQLFTLYITQGSHVLFFEEQWDSFYRNQFLHYIYVLVKSHIIVAVIWFKSNILITWFVRWSGPSLDSHTYEEILYCLLNLQIAMMEERTLLSYEKVEQIIPDMLKTSRLSIMYFPFLFLN